MPTASHRWRAGPATVSQAPCFLLLLAVGSVAQLGAQQFPAQAGSPPPHAGPLVLGQSLASLDSALGKPCSQKWPRPGRESRLYQGRGLSIIADSTGGLVWVQLFLHSAGDLADLRVGDSRELVFQRWGKPRLTNGDVLLYPADRWAAAVYLDPTGEFVYALSLGRPEFYPASDLGLVATIKRAVRDLYAAGDSLGLFGIISVANFLLWRRYKYWVPKYVHVLALLAFLTIAWLNWMWVQAGGQLTVRRMIIILTFPAIVYFFFVGAGGVKAALARRSAG